MTGHSAQPGNGGFLAPFGPQMRGCGSGSDRAEKGTISGCSNSLCGRAGWEGLFVRNTDFSQPTGNYNRAGESGFQQVDGRP